MKLRLTLYAALAAAILCLSIGSLADGIHLRTGTIDTDAVSSAQTTTKPPIGSGYYLVQLRGVVTESDKNALAGAGCELVEYIPDHTFLVRVQHGAVGIVKKLDCVKWMAPFRAEYKLSPNVASASGTSQFLVTLFPGQDSQFVGSKGRHLGVSGVSCVENARGGLCKVLVDASKIGELAQTSAVSWIEPFDQPKLCNDVAEGISGVPETRQNLSLFGSTQLVGVADSGLDTGDLSTLDVDFANRVEKTYGYRRPGEWSDLNGHGTHVVGSVLGSGALSGGNPTTHSYAGSFAGYAPEAKLVLQSIGDSGAYVFPPLHLADLFEPVYDDGVRVHSDSWGSSAKGEYTVYCNELDQFIWDHKDFAAVFAVGNDGVDKDRNGIIDPGCIDAPASAKNCISVGATESNRTSGGYQYGYGMAWPADYPVSPIRYDPMSNNPNGMVAFSGRGPTQDGRIKPDICAPGTNIISCRSHIWGADPGWAVYDANYIYLGGTSMSTPQVAGAAALVREYYQREKGVNPSAALIKASLINGAIDISPGQYGTGLQREVYPVPDNAQGWGRMNVKQSLCPDPPMVNEFADETSALTTGDHRDYYYTVVDNTAPFRATLVWTDYPGSVHASKELVNDLDLTVASPTGAQLPLTANHKDNVEQVTIANPELGTYRVRVEGYEVPMGPQDYALVVSGGLPGGYISGTVSSTSGAPVQGAAITIVSTNGNKRVTTNAGGKYVSHVSPGDYSVQISKQGWTFPVRAQMVHVENAPKENVNFQGYGAPGTLSGIVTQAAGGTVSHTVESSHPYLNSSNILYNVSAHNGASRIRVHFAELDMMNDGDSVYIEDTNGNRIDTFTYKGEDFWSSWVTGSSLNVRLVTTDSGNIAYGFYIDGFETDLVDQGGLGGVAVRLTPGDYTTTSAADGTYSLASVPPGTYNVACSKQHWNFAPTSKSIEVPAAGAASGVAFQGFPPGSITGEVRSATATAYSTSIESDHPYTNSTDRVWVVDGGPSATRVRLHFTKIETEAGFDWVYILDGNKYMVESYTALNNDVWTPWVTGRIAKIELTTDSGNTYWGFACDKYEIQTIGGGLAGVKIDIAPDARSTVTAIDGTFRLDNVDAGDHVVTPSATAWVFDPASATANISAGVEQHLVFYAALADLTSPAQAKSLADNTQVTLRGLTVSAVFSGCFYAQNTTMANGIKVISSFAVHEGDKVDVIGAIVTVDGERRITATSVSKR